MCDYVCSLEVDEKGFESVIAHVKAENFKTCLSCFETLCKAFKNGLACFGNLFGAFKNVRVIPGTYLELWVSFAISTKFDLYKATVPYFFPHNLASSLTKIINTLF